MAGAKADLLLTDPPYGINADRQHFEGHGWVLREKTEWDKDRPSREAIENARAMASEQIVWGGNYFTDYLPPSMGWLVWDKGQRDFSLADCELAWRSERKAARVFTYARAKSNREELHHPTQKPVGLMAWCVEQSNDAKTIYDPFLGSGTTLIAAEQLGRKCYGMEISPAYCDVIVKRWETLTGKKATREEVKHGKTRTA
jgi:DNA modification methylase